MPLVDLHLELEDSIPPEISAFIQAAQEVTEEIGERDPPIAAFVPSDYAMAYRALRALAESTRASGRYFCEWGSGLGVVACLAAAVGFRAFGIEIERDLVREARKLAERFGYRVEFACGSFVPPGGDRFLDAIEEFAWLDPGGADGHELLDLEPDDLDVVFAYPWPGEEVVVYDLFEHYAETGAILVTYLGREGVRWRQKRPRASR